VTKHFKRWIFVLVVLALLWLSFCSYEIWAFGATDHAVPSDSAIVLGTAVIGTEPSPEFEQRIRHAINLYRASTISKIIFTGGLAQAERLAESTVGLNYALAAGVPSNVMYAETKSRTTYENLLEAKILMQQHGLQTAVIVSDPLHLKRAAAMADDIGIQAVTSPTPTSQSRRFGTKIKFLLRELFLCHQYFITGQ